MSFAIFQTGGKQYKVVPSKILKIEKINQEAGKKIEFKDVLAYGNEKDIEIGSPIIKGAKVEAEILKNLKNRTVIVFKKRRRKNSRKRYGHRQPQSLIQITKIFSKNGKILSEMEKKPVVAKKVIAKKTEPIIKKKTTTNKKKW